MLCCKSAEGQLVLPRVSLANTFWLRLKGLLGRQALAPDEGLLIRPCNSVHSLGMRFSIGVVFLDADNQIVHLIPELAPGRLSPLIRPAKQVLELHPETLDRSSLKTGQQLHFSPC
ncbi:MAG: DUF192 domain-containing protein [Candidatus Sericytochromatia bacterium]|nr:DUF192 domain-containing protein [Candidatus Sericytochromatia bacterium]